MCNVGRIREFRKKDILSALHKLSCHFLRSADSRLPERHVKDMMQSKRDQGTFHKTEQKRSEIPGACHKTAHRINTVLHGRPHVIEQNTDKEIHNRGYDRYKPCPAEKRQGTRQFDPVKPVVQRRHAKSYDNTAKHTNLQRWDSADRCNTAFQYKIRDLPVFRDLAVQKQQGIDRCMHDKIGNNRRKRRHLFFLLCHTDRHTNGKKQWQVIKNRAAHTAHDHEQGMCYRAFSQNPRQVIRFDRCRIGKGTADPKQKSRYGQDCDRQHKAPSHAL